MRLKGMRRKWYKEGFKKCSGRNENQQKALDFPIRVLAQYCKNYNNNNCIGDNNDYGNINNYHDNRNDNSNAAIDDNAVYDYDNDNSNNDNINNDSGNNNNNDKSHDNDYNKNDDNENNNDDDDIDCHYCITIFTIIRLIHHKLRHVEFI